MNANDRREMPEWHDPFAEPRTQPAGWDFTGLRQDAPSAPPPAKRRKARRPELPAHQIVLPINVN